MTLLEVNNHATWKIVAPASSLHAACDDSPIENSSFASLLGQFDRCCSRISPGYCPAVGLLL